AGAAASFDTEDPERTARWLKRLFAARRDARPTENAAADRVKQQALEDELRSCVGKQITWVVTLAGVGTSPGPAGRAWLRFQPINVDGRPFLELAAVSKSAPEWVNRGTPPPWQNGFLVESGDWLLSLKKGDLFQARGTVVRASRI